MPYHLPKNTLRNMRNIICYMVLASQSFCGGDPTRAEYSLLLFPFLSRQYLRFEMLMARFRRFTT
jgi:hypothetical protein